MQLNILSFLMLVLLLVSCNEKGSKTIKDAAEFKNDAHKLVYEMVEKAGNYEKLLTKENVIYTYTYQTPDGKKDVSTEKYIFDGELSYGEYKIHERTLSDLEGTIVQAYDGENYWLKHNGDLIDNEKALNRVKFNRPTNFYWFTMMQKLLDPGLNYESLGTKEIDGLTYDIVKVTFESYNHKPKDIYQLYINRETKLVDQFLFTVADFGRMEPLLMQVEYEKIDGILIPTKRKYKSSDWDATITPDPWILVNWTDIKFNNNISKNDFKM